jgi:hypothetical protein
MSNAAPPPWDSACVLIWAPAGAVPDLARLGELFVQTPPRPNPAPFWRLRDAVEHAGETIENARHAGKEPWIKVGDWLYNPLDITGFYRTIRTHPGTL